MTCHVAADVFFDQLIRLCRGGWTPGLVREWWTPAKSGHGDRPLGTQIPTGSFTEGTRESSVWILRLVVRLILVKEIKQIPGTYKRLS